MQQLEPEKTDLYICNNEVKCYVSSKTQLDNNTWKSCVILIQQCTYNLKAQIEASLYLTLVNRDADVLGLIGLIKGLLFKFEENKNLADAIQMVSKAFYG